MKHNITSRLLQTFALALLPFAASGQNLDPTVEVSRTYEGKLMEVHKPQLRMEVPDSVLNFDLEFDYSVTDKPYKGSYEFSPYTVEMKPSPAVRDHRTLYLKAGAGYQLHPTLDLVWSPEFKKPFRMNVYAFNRSFVGNYWNIAETDVTGSEVVLDRVGNTSGKDIAWYGYDFQSRAGVDGRYDWEKALFKFDVFYDGIHQKDGQAMPYKRSYNAFEAKMGLASKKASGGFLYSAGASYRYGTDALSGELPEIYGLKSQEFDFDAELGYALLRSGRLLFDMGFEWASASDGDSRQIGGNIIIPGRLHGADLDLAPHYMMKKGRWLLDLGVRFSLTYSSSKYTDVQGFEGYLLYPDVRIEYSAIRDALKLYVDVAGDSRLNAYSDVLGFNRRANQLYAKAGQDLMDVTVERLNACVGFEGRIGPRFAYNLRGGYADYADALLDGVVMSSEDAETERWILPMIGYSSYKKAYAALDWTLAAENIKMDGSVEYAHPWMGKGRQMNGLFLPASLAGDVSVSYVWKKRLSVGLDCGFSTAREAHMVTSSNREGDLVEVVDKDVRMPGYADLGLNLEYAVNRKFSVWARGGNMLGMTVQRSVLYAEKGPYFTAGICLNL